MSDDTSEGLQRLVHAFNSHDKEEMADFFREIIVEELRTRCMVVVEMSLDRDMAMRTAKLTVTFLGTGIHPEDLLATDEACV